MKSFSRTVIHLTLPEAIRHWAIYRPEHPALITDDGALTYAELHSLILSCRNSLRELRLEQSSPIALLISDKPQFITALNAVLIEGHVPVLLNIKLDPTLLSTMVNDANCRALIADCDTVTALNNEGTIPDIRLPIRASNITMFAPEPPVARFADDTWAIIYSSGTTGIPKGIVRSEFSVLTELFGWCLELTISRNTVAFIGRPVYYTGGLMLTAATLLSGGSIILPNSWSPDAYWALLSRYYVDFAFLIPDQVRELVTNIEQGDPQPQLGRILTMGAPMPVDLKQMVRSVLRCGYVESWGNSEGLGTITSEDDLWARPTSIGRPFLADRMYVVDENGVPLPTGQIGRIAGSTDSTLTNYQNRRDLDQQFIRGGMVISEDIGFMDDSGYFYLKGRASQRFLRNGEPVFAGEIEGVLRRFAEIRDVAAVAVADRLEGHVPIAFIVAPDPDYFDMGSFLAAANDLLPVQHRLVAGFRVDELPRNSAGKVEYHRLEQLANKMRSERQLKGPLLHG